MTFAQVDHGVHGLGEGVVPVMNRRTIPFDYAFRFDLTGQPETVQNKTLTVSIEASFTSVSIGYGVIPTVSPVKFGLLPKQLAGGLGGDRPNDVEAFVGALQDDLKSVLVKGGGLVLGAGGGTADSRNAIRRFAQHSFLRMTVAALAETLKEPLNSARPVIGKQTAAALRNGLKFNPDLVERALLSLGGDAPFDDASLLETFQAVAAPPEQIQFKYALFDEGSGREFQSEPVLNTAGLGASDGGRPFRYFARPVEFAPRTTIRMQVTEVSDFEGELHVSLQGFKTLGGWGTPTSVRAPRSARRRVRP